MPDSDLVVFVEESSAFEIVRAIARTLDIYGRVTVLKHQGAGELERSYGKKIANDPFPNTKFLLLRDSDNKDCRLLKRKLLEGVPAAKRGKTRVRLVCQELEAWYLAQPDALAAAGCIQRPIARGKLRGDVDSIADPKRIFLRHAHNSGQIELARRIGPCLDIASTKSASFKHFVSALRMLAEMR